MIRKFKGRIKLPYLQKGYKKIWIKKTENASSISIIIIMLYIVVVVNTKNWRN